MNTGLLFFLLALLFSALWIIEREARKAAQNQFRELLAMHQSAVNGRGSENG